MARPMRSWMFVPGNRQRFLDKAAACDADAVYLDLEDGVLPAEKEAARDQVAATLAVEGFRPLRYVRVNALPTPWFEDDVRAVVVAGIDGVCLPKVEAPDEVGALAKLLGELEAERGLEPGSVRIVAAIETAVGLLAAPAVARADPRMAGLMFGAEDFALDLGLSSQREGEAAELIHARSSLVVACAAARIISIDGVFPNLEDPEGFLADVVQARRLGFGAKSTFNPRQVDVINRVFTPEAAEIEYARTVVAAFEAAEARGDASVAVGGQLVDRPIVMRAQRILELVDRLGAEAAG